MPKPTASFLRTNLAHARSAVYTVRQVHDVLAGNRAVDQIQSLARPQLASSCVRDLRALINQRCYADQIALVKEIAQLARQKQCGNCGEMACLAFVTLMDSKVAPLDILSLTHGDHAFVVIGRDANSDLNKPDTWGNQSVICDPWQHRAYPAAAMRLLMTVFGATRGCSLLVRWEG